MLFLFILFMWDFDQGKVGCNSLNCIFLVLEEMARQIH